MPLTPRDTATGASDLVGFSESRLGATFNDAPVNRNPGGSAGRIFEPFVQVDTAPARRADGNGARTRHQP